MDHSDRKPASATSWFTVSLALVTKDLLKQPVVEHWLECCTDTFLIEAEIYIADICLLTKAEITVSVPFKMNTTSGEILLRSSVDREQTDEITFTLYTIGHDIPTFTVTTEVKVTISDVNDNRPEFSAPGGYQGVLVESTSTSLPDSVVSLVREQYYINN